MMTRSPAARHYRHNWSMKDSWDSRIDQFWDSFDGSRPDQMFADMREIVDERPADDGPALYEWASVNDSLGSTAEAIEYYRLGIAAGLDDLRRPQAALQLASSLRAEGEPQEAIDVLDALQADATHVLDIIGAAPSVVRALALHDLGRKDEALSVALIGLSTTLPLYRRSMTAYAEAIVDKEEA